MEALENIGWALLFSILGGLLGVCIVMTASLVVPRILARITPNLDEEKEIARGNVAVAEYFGRVTAACILGISLIIAAAVLGGFLAALHGPTQVAVPVPSTGGK
jgi:uncharacterized membrane protein YdcZ (DUF606 family)